MPAIPDQTTATLILRALRQQGLVEPGISTCDLEKQTKIDAIDPAHLIALSSMHMIKHRFSRAGDLLRESMPRLRDSDFELAGIALLSESRFETSGTYQQYDATERLETLSHQIAGRHAWSLDIALLSFAWMDIQNRNFAHGSKLLRRLVVSNSSSPTIIYLAFCYMIRMVMMQKSGSKWSDAVLRHLERNSNPMSEIEAIYEEMLAATAISFFHVDVLVMRGTYFNFCQKWYNAIEDFTAAIECPGIRYAYAFSYCYMDALKGRANSYAETGQFMLSQEDRFELSQVMDDALPYFYDDWRAHNKRHFWDRIWPNGILRRMFGNETR